MASYATVFGHRETAAIWLHSYQHSAVAVNGAGRLITRYCSVLLFTVVLYWQTTDDAASTATAAAAANQAISTL